MHAAGGDQCIPIRNPFHLGLLLAVLLSILNLAIAAPTPYTPINGVGQDIRDYQYPQGYHPDSEAYQYKWDPKWLETMNQMLKAYVVNEPLAYIPAGSDHDTAMPQLWNIAQALVKHAVKLHNEELEAAEVIRTGIELNYIRFQLMHEDDDEEVLKRKAIERLSRMTEDEDDDEEDEVDAAPLAPMPKYRRIEPEPAVDDGRPPCYPFKVKNEHCWW